MKDKIDEEEGEANPDKWLDQDYQITFAKSTQILQEKIFDLCRIIMDKDLSPDQIYKAM